MYCPECGFHQSDAHKYCGRCGALLIVENQGTGEITGPLAISDEEAETGAWQGPAIEGPTLAVRSGGPPGAIFSLDRETVTIGREPSADVFLDDVTVSRNHAVVVRSASLGDRLAVVPYHEAYRDDVQKLARLLDQAARVAPYPELASFLGQRSREVLTDDYFTGDCRWVRMGRTPIEVVLGPYETYRDRILGTKALYEAVILRVDEEASRLIQFQQQYQAAAKVIATARAIFDEVLDILR